MKTFFLAALMAAGLVALGAEARDFAATGELWRHPSLLLGHRSTGDMLSRRASAAAQISLELASPYLMKPLLELAGG